MKIRVPRIAIKTVPVTCRLDADLHADLEAYAAAYEAQYGEAIPLAVLIITIVRDYPAAPAGGGFATGTRHSREPRWGAQPALRALDEGKEDRMPEHTRPQNDGVGPDDRGPLLHPVDDLTRLEDVLQQIQQTLEDHDDNPLWAPRQVTHKAVALAQNLLHGW